MYWYTNGDAFEFPCWSAENGGGPSHYAPARRRQIVPVTTGSSSSSQMDRSSVDGSPYQESHVPVGVASNAGSQWSSAPFPVPSPSAYWARGQLDQALGSPFDAPAGNPNGFMMAFPMETEVAPPELEQAFPMEQRALPTSQLALPPWAWTPLSAPSFDPTSTWDCPVHSVRPHSAHSFTTGSGGVTHEFPFLPATPPATTGSGHSFVPNRTPASLSAPNSVQSSTLPAQDASAAPRPRGERWPSSNARMFPCMWRSGEKRCGAPVAGERKGISSHLRYEHNFTCDGQPVKCEWDGCTAFMQRRNVPRHILSCHLEIKVKCPRCRLSLSRADANKKHQDVCMGPKTPAEIEEAEQRGGVYFSSGDGGAAF